MSSTERIYLEQHFPECVFARFLPPSKSCRVKATRWSVVVNSRGAIEEVVPLCSHCYRGYKDLMAKTYGPTPRKV